MSKNVLQAPVQTPETAEAQQMTLIGRLGAFAHNTYDAVTAHVPTRQELLAYGTTAVTAVGVAGLVAQSAEAQNQDASAAGVKTANGLYFKDSFSPGAMKRAKKLGRECDAGFMGVNGNLDGRHPVSKAGRNPRLPGVSLTVKRLPIDGAIHQRFYLKYPKKFKICDITEDNVDKSITFMGDALQKKVKKTKTGYSLVWTDPNVWANDSNNFTSSFVAYFNKKK